MNKIQEAFRAKNAFVPFITAGDPNLDKTYDYILEMEKAGASLIQIGIPFSDPIAEGKVVQAANVRALSNGCTTDKIFEMIIKVRKETNIPLVFVAYLNTVFKYGSGKFCQKCQEAGVDGLIISDMPFEEKGELKEDAEKYGVAIISQIAPTSKERIAKIAKEASGYIYVVSKMGSENENKGVTEQIVAQIKEVTDIPVVIKPADSTKELADDCLEYADGVMAGNAIVKLIEKYGENAAKPIFDYVKKMAV